MDVDTVDVVIVGAGPAGLSAALILGRCLRRVVVLDDGRPRNGRSRALHGFLTRDGVPPARLLEIARDELRRYETVTLESAQVIDAVCLDRGFEVSVSGGRQLRSRKLLLATGVTDRLPDIDGFAAFYGRGVYHCPYCDGWEHRGQPLVVYGRGRRGYGLALELTAWSRDVVLSTDGDARLTAAQVQRLRRHRIRLREQRVLRLEGDRRGVSRVVFATGQPVPCRAVFFTLGQHQRSALARHLGCEFTPKGAVRTRLHEQTNVPGLFVAGDASRNVQLAIVAAAEGAEAGFAINSALLAEDLRRRDSE